MKKMRTAIIGMGVGEKHLEAYMHNPFCEVAGVCDFSEEKINDIRKKYPGTRTVRDAGELINDDSINLISIASYDNYHFEQITGALKNNKHVFVEKPLCLYRDEAVEIKKLINENPSLKISSNFILRKSPRFKVLKEKIEKGELGELYHIEGDYNYGRIHKITEGWRGKIPFYSVVYGGAVHMIDLMLWMTGSNIGEVHAFGNNISTKNSQFKYSDMVVSIMKFDNGITGKVSANFSCMCPHFHKFVVYGDEATFENDVPDARLYRSRDPQVNFEKIDSEYPGVHKGGLLDNFVNSIMAGEEAEIKVDDVFRAMSVCFAIEESLETARPVQVEYI